ncbi:MAG: PilT/PilU family type 4a pilus ATPase [gamma proteobacterium symbiont of Bathyaustriella thionipta]|nr:PilT/PilU family type 4a pilus ATPase [gamma proteobacterium symbiont of Bathyaustriella thionipta]
MANFDSLLKMMVTRSASDMFISSGSPIHMKVKGKLLKITDFSLKSEEAAAIAYKMMNKQQRLDFEKKPELNLGMSGPQGARFRVNVFRQRGDISIVIRYLPSKIPGLDALHLPKKLHELVMLPRGMILVVGATGSGKSTTLASLVDYRNSSSRSHILTLEDPIEFIHEYKKSVVNQREIGSDTLCYEDAMMNAMREAPDVILIGEIRNKDAMEHTITYSETGHLVLATLHASNASHAIDRIVNFFSEEARPQVLSDLSRNLQAIVSQRLIMMPDGERVAAVELMIVTPRIADLISKGDLSAIREQMEKSPDDGVQTYDQAIFKLIQEKKISVEEGMKNAESATNLNVMLRLQRSSGRPHER